jgi:multisubunit Na+/H+ antiporter MnhF subunit
MESIINIITWIVLSAHLLMALIAAWRVWRGENNIARLTALDLASTLTLAVLILISILTKNSIFMDTAIALAALSYLATVALAKFISDQKVF